MNDKSIKIGFKNRFQYSYLLLIFLTASTQSFAQEMEGSIRYLLLHNWAKKMAAVDYLSKQQKDKVSYMWGNESEWKQYANLYFNAAGSKYEDSDERAEADDQGYSWRKDVYVIRRDFAQNKTIDLIQLLGKTYLIEDSLVAPDWKIKNDMKEVAGHICMNAFWEDTLKQEKISVWFALDMPLSAGPERLCGLPGIILEANYNDGALSIVADKIEMKKLEHELDLPKKIKAKKITELAYQDIIRKQMAEKKENEEPWFWGMRY
ncbi:MAG: GLPGLI family protein [Bacteroidota bacterium]